MSDNGTAAASVSPPSALAVREEYAINRHAFEPRNWTEAKEVATLIVTSKLGPSALDTWQKAAVIIMRGRELGLTVMQALSCIYVIDGRTAMAADLMAALVLESGKAEYFDVIETTPTRCAFATKRRGGRREITIEWTIEMARTARLVGRDNWIKYPQAMLRARCKADLARAVYPEVVTGIYDPDELSDLVIDVSPSNEPLPPTIGDRIKAAGAAYNAFEQSYGREHVESATGKTRAELCTVEDWEAAVTKLRSSVFETASRLAQSSAAESQQQQPAPTPVVEPIPDAVATDDEDDGRGFYQEDAEAEAREGEVPPGWADEPPPVVPESFPPTGLPIDDRLLLAALRASTYPSNTNLAAVSREKFQKNPDRLDQAERRQLLTFLGSKAKVGK